MRCTFGRSPGGCTTWPSATAWGRARATPASGDALQGAGAAAVSTPSSREPNAHTMGTITAVQIRFSQKPAFTICGIETRPEAKTIAFGGVATGSMNEQLVATTAGVIRASG